MVLAHPFLSLEIIYTSSMQRVSECELVVLYGAAAKTSLLIQKVFDCKWYQPLRIDLRTPRLLTDKGSIRFRR